MVSAATYNDKPIGPTKERLRHAGEDVEAFSPDENVNFKTLRMLDGSPLEKLATAGRNNDRKGITGEQYHAGARYFADAFHAQLLASGVIDPTKQRVDCEGYKDIPDRRLAAQTRFNRACKAIGPVHQFVLDDVVLAESPIHVFADRFRQFSRHRDRMVAALTALRMALDALDIHYNGNRRMAQAYHSHADNYRPTLSPVEEP